MTDERVDIVQTDMPYDWTDLTTALQYILDTPLTDCGTHMVELCELAATTAILNGHSVMKPSVRVVLQALRDVHTTGQLKYGRRT